MDKRFENFDLALHKAAMMKSDNALKEFLDKNNFKKDKDVVEVYMPFEDMTEIRPLDRFKNLTKLWLHSNKLQHLPFIQNCYSLSELYLQHNLIQSIEFCFRNLYNITVLFLQGNQITDLDSTANEVSYLKFLKNLNLFDNPIALEKNYRKLVVYKVPSLEIFDRNTVKENERIRAIKYYEPEKVESQKKFAFMRCVNLDELNQIQTKQKNILRSSSLSSFNLSVNFDRESEKSKIKDDSNKKLLSLRRSIKEFSYFDWSKVKLKTKDYFENVELQKVSHNKLSKNNFNELPQVITIRFT